VRPGPSGARAGARTDLPVVVVRLGRVSRLFLGREVGGEALPFHGSILEGDKDAEATGLRVGIVVAADEEGVMLGDLIEVDRGGRGGRSLVRGGGVRGSGESADVPVAGGGLPVRGAGGGGALRTAAREDIGAHEIGLDEIDPSNELNGARGGIGRLVRGGWVVAAIGAVHIEGGDEVCKLVGAGGAPGAAAGGPHDADGEGDEAGKEERGQHGRDGGEALATPIAAGKTELGLRRRRSHAAANSRKQAAFLPRAGGGMGGPARRGRVSLHREGRML